MTLDVVAATRRATDRFRALARDIEHSAPVQHLPGWSVRDLVAHLTGDHVWALRVLRTGTNPGSGLAAAPETGRALLDRLDEVTEELLAGLALAAAEPDRPCWNFAQGRAGVAGWWPRHQVHEAVVHLWDLESVSGSWTALDPALSVDGVDELVATYTNRYAGQALSRPLVLRCPGHAAWRAEPAGTEGRVRVERVDPSIVADVEAEPGDLLLAMWHRIPADDPRLSYVDPATRADTRGFLAGPLTA
jgi:uncharacterized protein (TIGR03083 family)